MSPPPRRSRRGQPVAVDSASIDILSDCVTGDPIYVRETDHVRDLRGHYQRQLIIDRRGAGALDALETRLYASFSRGDENVEASGIKREKKVYGKQKATFEEFKVGDTVLVETPRKLPAVGVIVAVMKIFYDEEAFGSNVLVHWFSRPEDLAALRPHRDVLQVRVTPLVYDAVSDTCFCAY